MDAAPTTEVWCPARCCPRVLPPGTIPGIRNSRMCKSAINIVGVGGSLLQGLILSVTVGVSLVSRPRLDVINSPSSLGIHLGRVGTYPAHVNFFKSKTFSVLPDGRPDPPAMAEDTGHASQEKDQDHVD